MASTTETDQNGATGPLEGVRVLELGSFIAGPFAGQLLGDYGADVVKVEPPGVGDTMRRWGLVRDGESLWWPSIGRNKRSITVNLRRPEGAALIREIVRECDVVLENFRPGQLETWGLGYEDLVAINPRLVMVHVSGFGRTGPRAGEAGFGSIGEAMGGIRHTTGEADRPSSRCGISLGDSLAALFAVVGTLAALVERDRSGKGQEVDVAIYEAVAALMESSLADFAVGGVVRGRSGGVLPGVSPSNAYPSKEGIEVLIAANADTVFLRLCGAMGRPELAEDVRFDSHEARAEHCDELDELIARWTETMPVAELLELLARQQIPAGQSYTAAEAMVDPQYLARDMVVHAISSMGLPTPMPGVVPKFGRTPGSVRFAGPALGADTADVLEQLAGLSSSEYEQLRSQGIV